jgi:hypothetical protein
VYRCRYLRLEPIVRRRIGARGATAVGRLGCIAVQFLENMFQRLVVNDRMRDAAIVIVRRYDHRPIAQAPPMPQTPRPLSALTHFAE